MTETPKTGVEFLEQFEPDVFWQQHGRKIIWGMAVVLAIGVVTLWRQRQAQEREQEAAAQLAQAADTMTLQRLAVQYKGKPTGAQALLRLADTEFQAHRYAEAASAYQQFLVDYPNHLLVDSARLGQAESAEAQGSFEAAKSQYLQLASRQDSHTAVAAKMGVARCAEALGQTKEARLLYEELLPAVAGTAWEGEVRLRWAILARTQPLTETNQATSSSLPNAEQGTRPE